MKGLQPPPSDAELTPKLGDGVCVHEELKRQSVRGKIQDANDFFVKVLKSKSRVEIKSLSLTSALGCLKVSKNSSSIAESTAMFAAGGGRGEDFRGSAPTSETAAPEREKRKHFRRSQP